MVFTTKADTLKSLQGILKNGMVLEQICFTIEEWSNNQNKVIDLIKNRQWLNINLIVRSSAVNEDLQDKSYAGYYCSVPNVFGEKSIIQAVDKVIKSYDDNNLNQVFIQPMLVNVKMCGVAFSRDPNTGGDYIVINYDESGSTSAITAGTTNNMRTYYHYSSHALPKNKLVRQVILLVNELSSLYNYIPLDIEFAYTEQMGIILLQVRPLIRPSLWGDVATTKLNNVRETHFILEDIENKFKQLNVKHPYLYGEQTLLGIMPDWNPAEIIGVRPKKLALSLYKEVITDSIWAYQRDNYGYKNLRSFPLLIDLYGLPYIDVRVSFNSFLPSNLNDDLSEKLTNYYIQRLIENPSLHDKVEFNIIFSCYTLDIKQRLNELKNYYFTEEECSLIASSLRDLTNKIIDIDNGLWKKDIKKIEQLDQRRIQIKESDLDDISKAYWLLEDCKRYGTLPFAGLARAGFIAVEILKSLVNMNILTDKDYELFMSELESISSLMGKDLLQLEKKDFLIKYGHLRPGTYDILSPRYDEDPDRYFDWNKKDKTPNKVSKFQLSLKQLDSIKECLKTNGIVHDVLSLFEFIKKGIEGREYAKFVFTKNLSDTIVLIKKIGEGYGFSKEDCSYLDIGVIKQLYSSSSNAKDILEKSIIEGKHLHSISTSITLPPLIVEPKDIWSFYMPSFEPNYITVSYVTGKVVLIDEEKNNFRDGIIFITNADPGYDWIFSHSIAGFVTMYGGINSHMAIRAGELGIPAIIGAGETLFNQWKRAQIISMDCGNKKVKMIR